MSNVAQQLSIGDISLEDAIKSEDVPAEGLHYFATNCAERSLLRYQDKTRTKADKRAWDALTIKRAWWIGQATSEDLEAASQAVLNARLEAESEYYWIDEWDLIRFGVADAAYLSAAWRATEVVASEAAERACYYATRYAIWVEEELAWESLGNDSEERMLFGRAESKEESWQRSHLIYLLELFEITEQLWLLYETPWRLPLKKIPLYP
jgi:hypothetical protein